MVPLRSLVRAEDALRLSDDLVEEVTGVAALVTLESKGLFTTKTLRSAKPAAPRMSMTSSRGPHGRRTKATLM